MRKYMPGWFAALLGMMVFLTAVVSRPAAAVPEEPAVRSSAAELFLDVFSMTRAAYVDTVDSKVLVESAIEGMLQSLDPNSMLLTPDEYENLQIQLEGSFEGIGVTIGQREGWLTVISPIEGTPAYRRGVRSGDRITAIDGTTTEGLATDEAVSRIRGPQGTTVSLTITRPGVTDTLEIQIERAVIDYPSVSAALMLSPEIGYVRLSRFSDSSAGETLEAIRTLQDSGMTSLVFDLRSNSGGLFNPAIDVADIFLPAGSLVVTTRGQAVGERSYYARRGVLFPGRVACLVDGGSASSAEIVAGALQDQNAAVLIGTRTFGKGSVQSLSDLGEYPGLGHYAVKLTTARYYTPSGRCIDRTLDEDFLAPGEEEDWGIEPDITIEIPEVNAELVLRLEEQAMFFKFATDYTLSHSVADDFWPGQEVIAAFREFLTAQAFEWSEEEFQASVAYIERALLREIALRVWTMDAYYRAIAPHDEYIQRAVQELQGTL
jgi:carboxyl-terminal processing protease